MASSTSETNLPPHLRGRIPGALKPKPAPQEQIIPLRVQYKNLVGDLDSPTRNASEPSQTVDTHMAEAWWAGLNNEGKIRIASKYLLDGGELPETKAVQPSVTVANAEPQVARPKLKDIGTTINVPASKPNVGNTATTFDKWEKQNDEPATGQNKPAQQDIWGGPSHGSQLASTQNDSSNSATPWDDKFQGVESLVRISEQPQVEGEAAPKHLAGVGLRSSPHDQDEFIKVSTSPQLQVPS